MLATTGSVPAKSTDAAVHADCAVTGLVVDENGLPGVTVAVQGSTSRASTDGDGSFTLPTPDTVANPTLHINFIDFVTQQVAMDDRTDICVTLREDVQKLSEVVVIAYGEQSPTTLTCAVSQIKGLPRPWVFRIGRPPTGPITSPEVRLTWVRALCRNGPHCWGCG